MIFIIKNSILFLMLICLSSCNNISYSQVIPLVKLATFGVEDIEIDDDFLNQQKFSFIKVNVGRTGVAILTLASIKNGVYTWVSASGEKLQTYNVKIIKSFDVVYDTHFITFSNFSLNESLQTKQFDYTVRLFNPATIVTQEAILKTLETPRFGDEGLYFEELVTTNGFKWRFVNKYWLNNDGYVTKSIQYLHPKLPKYEINFYYK